MVILTFKRREISQFLKCARGRDAFRFELATVWEGLSFLHDLKISTGNCPFWPGYGLSTSSRVMLVYPFVVRRVTRWMQNWGINSTWPRIWFHQCWYTTDGRFVLASVWKSGPNGGLLSFLFDWFAIKASGSSVWLQLTLGRSSLWRTTLRLVIIVRFVCRRRKFDIFSVILLLPSQIG